MLNFNPKILTTMKSYDKTMLAKDIGAGMIVAIIALPLSIALAIASGVAPEQGLYTAIIAGFIISLLGGSRVQIGGPTGAFMVIVYGIVTEFGIEGLTVATLMAGAIIFLLGFFKLGNMIKFIPYPITTGFTSGIALTIFSSQVKDFLGLETPALPAEFLEKWAIYLEHMDSIDWSTVSIGIFSLVIILFWPNINRKIPGAFIALIVTSLVVKFTGLEVATIGSKFGELSSSLPKFGFPSINGSMVRSLIGPAVTIAMLGSIESLLSAVVADGMIGGKHRSNTELMAQGLANIASALFGGIPATGAIARTAANVKNGGRTPVAGIVHAITLLLIMLLFMPLAKMIPLATLAAILVVVAYNMSEWRRFRDMLKSSKGDLSVLLITFFLTVLVDLVVAIEVGMVLAAFVFMKRMSNATTFKELDMDAAEEQYIGDAGDIGSNALIEAHKEIQVYEINGPFFFGAADTFIEQFKDIDRKSQAIVIRMRHVSMIDATAMNAFKSVVKRCKKRQIPLYISGLKEELEDKLKKSGLHQEIGSDHFFNHVDDAIQYHASLKS